MLVVPIIPSLIKEDLLNIRKAKQDDIFFLASVMLHVYEEKLSLESDWNPDRFLKKFMVSTENEVLGKVENSITYVIEHEAISVGRLRIVQGTAERHIAGLQILPSYQNKGIGSDVILKLINDALEEEIPLSLDVEKDNPNAKALYLRLGFKVTGNLGDKELMEFQCFG